MQIITYSIADTIIMIITRPMTCFITYAIDLSTHLSHHHFSLSVLSLPNQVGELMKSKEEKELDNDGKIGKAMTGGDGGNGMGMGLGGIMQSGAGGLTGGLSAGQVHITHPIKTFYQSTIFSTTYDDIPMNVPTVNTLHIIYDTLYDHNR